MTPDEPIQRAAEAVARAEALLVMAGAGMGVDSGLPDFRGDEGFWHAYPPYAKLGLSFSELASPDWFRKDVGLAWGFYGHRLNLYRATQPHAGFARLRRWAEGKGQGAFVFTSNVDGQFQRAGFDPERIAECHGAIEWLQCLDECGLGIFSAPAEEITLDPETFRASPPYPRCPECAGLARPNILMFGDSRFDSRRAEAQYLRYHAWLRVCQPERLVIVECGAGQAIPTVRNTSERIADGCGATLVRINPREFDGPRGTISIPLGAGAALAAIDEALSV